MLNLMQFAVLLIASSTLLGVGNARASSDAGRETRVAWVDTCPNEPTPTPASGRKSAVVGGLIAVIAPKLIEGAVDSAAEALKAAGQPHTVTSTARSGVYFYKVSKSADLVTTVTCLVIVRGIFKPGAPSPALLAKTGSYAEMNGLQSASFQMEAKMRPLRGAKYFQLFPQYLKVESFEEQSLFDRKDRDFLVTAAMSLPGATQPFGSAEFLFKDVQRDGKALFAGDPRLRAAASLPIAFPAESSDATKAKTNLDAVLAPWLLALDIQSPVPTSPPKAPSTLDDKLKKAMEKFCADVRTYNATVPEQHAVSDDNCKYVFETSRAGMKDAVDAAYRNSERVKWAGGLCTYRAEDPNNNPDGPDCSNMPLDPAVVKSRAALAQKEFTYLTTQVTLQETREGSKLALFLGTALASSKAEVSATLKEKLLPKTKAEQEAADSTARQALNAVQLADLDVERAESMLGETLGEDDPKASDITAARIDLLKAKIAANAARRKVGLPVLYAEVQ